MKALFFWAGGEIPNLFKYCIESFVKNGFETIVYSPEPDINKNCLANDIDLRQSDEILPIEILYKFKYKKLLYIDFGASYFDIIESKM